MSALASKYRLVLLGLMYAYSLQVVAENINLAAITINNTDPPAAVAATPAPEEAETPAPTAGAVDAETNAVIAEPESLPAEEPKSAGPKVIKSTPIKNTYSLAGSKKMQVKASEKPQQYELHGVVNQQYVYMIVEKTGKNDVVGYLFDGKGNKKYIYGEWVNKQLQIFDPSNKKLTVSLEDEPSPSSSQVPSADSRHIGKNNTVFSTSGQINVSPDVSLKNVTIINHSTGATPASENLQNASPNGSIGIR